MVHKFCLFFLDFGIHSFLIFFCKFSFSGCMIRYLLARNVKLQLTMNKVDQSKRVDMKPETLAGSVLVLTKACPICIARKILMIFESTCCACTEITQTIFVAIPVAVSLSHKESFFCCFPNVR